MNISISDALQEFVEQQVMLRGFRTSSEYVRELIRKDQERQALRGRLRASVLLPAARTGMALPEHFLRRAQTAAE
ncbi:MAG: addiction module antitoxin [Moraxellaceae bacterium]|jgi:antitoxin ParD1/3/4|nr:addiction module antitoxin [Moraxellaceae bacterium]